MGGGSVSGGAVGGASVRGVVVGNEVEEVGDGLLGGTDGGSGGLALSAGSVPGAVRPGV
ncbi:hypothetical protein BH20CHL6_BH20CHL6_08640 [soil metagenome]